MSLRLIESLTYPFSDERWWKKFLIGWLVNAVPFLNFAATGYVAKIYRNRIQKSEESLPEWDDWILFLKHGVMIFAVVCCYIIVPGTVLSWLFPTWTTIAGLIIIGMCFLLPMSIGNFVLHYRFKDAFDFKQIIQRIKSVFQEYVIVFFIVLGFGTFMYVFLRQWQLRRDPFSWILLSGIHFYVQLVLFKIFGDVFPVQKGDIARADQADSIEEDS